MRATCYPGELSSSCHPQRRWLFWFESPERLYFDRRQTVVSTMPRTSWMRPWVLIWMRTTWNVHAINTTGPLPPTGQWQPHVAPPFLFSPVCVKNRERPAACSQGNVCIYFAVLVIYGTIVYTISTGMYFKRITFRISTRKIRNPLDGISSIHPKQLK